jgi:hypothetical protein
VHADGEIWNAVNYDLRQALVEKYNGGPDYQGEQDADPLNATDCGTASDQGTFLHAAEFEVFGQDITG